MRVLHGVFIVIILIAFSLATGGCKGRNDTQSAANNDYCDYDSVLLDDVDIVYIADTCAVDSTDFEY